jgi:glycosyltransferase involved in cell wall biosynthesis
VNLAFFDVINWDYDAGTPYERPLGGSQSALSYLAAALGARGHAVTMFSSTTRPRTFQGVKCQSNLPLNPAQFAAFDALIVLNGPADICLALRPHLPAGCRLILWTQCSFDQPAMFPLKRPEVRKEWDTIVCVSQWHAAAMQREYGLDPHRIAVIRNAIAPAFVNLYADAAELARAKTAQAVLTYTSTPFRGLDVLLSVFPDVHRHDPRASLHVYSSLKVYGQDEDGDPYVRLYATCRSSQGVEYHGSLVQSDLAAALKPAMILAYPNTFAETSCIAVMEAMAAGLLVVTSDLGALPETTMEMGVLVPGPRHPGDLEVFARNYRDRLVATMQEIARHPQQHWSARWEQVQAMTTRFTWPVRAAEWEQLLGTCKCHRPCAAT